MRLQPPKAVVNDINRELINVYAVVRDKVGDLIEDLKKHKNEAEYYYKIRNLDRDKRRYDRLSTVEKASRTLFLNKTCYNGLYRVNRRGEFNTPFGRYKNPNIVNAAILKATSSYLRQAEITLKCCDFEEAIKDIKKSAFAYFDPPYDPVSDSASFTGYDKDGFSKDEQKRLKRLCDGLDSRGVRFLLSNSATDFILELYKDYNITIVQARRAVNSKANKRGEVNEVLIKNYG